MDVQVWTVSSYVMAGLSFSYLPNYALLCNAFAFSAYSDKCMDIACIAICLTWLASIWELLGCSAWEMQMILILLHLESTP
jgi:hypothetical protein